MVHLTITPHAGRTRIRIEENLTPVAGGYFGGILGGGGGAGMGIGMGVGVGALHSPIFAAVFLVSALTGSYTLARTLFRGTAQRRGEELEDLLDRLAHYIQETGGGGRRALPR